MALTVGVVLALAIGIFGTVVGLDRDRAFYPTVMIVIALIYVLFAAAGGSTHALALELIPGVLFIAAATVGFKTSLWIVVAALAGHGVFDAFHARAIVNPGVPTWWPPFCLAYDVVAAAYLAWLLARGRVPAAAGGR